MNAEVEKMIEDNKRLVYSIANSMYVKNKLFSKEDLIQVGFLALCKSGHKYDENRGKVSTFITHCVRNDILKFIKSNKLQNDLLYSENTNLSYNSNNFDYLDRYDFFCAKTDLEKDVIRLKIDGKNNKAISSELNISTSKVSKILSLIKSRMDRRRNA